MAKLAVSPVSPWATGLLATSWATTVGSCAGEPDIDRNERSATAGDGGSEMSLVSLSECKESGVDLGSKRSGIPAAAVGRMGERATIDLASSSECSSLSAAARCVFA